MLACRTHKQPTERRGAILLVVLAMLALFAVIGLSFALYSEAEATSSRIKRESVNDADPFADDSVHQQYANKFLGQLIYDVPDTATAGNQDVTSVLRGHGLARLMYGANPTTANIAPYNGIGLFSDAITPVTGITNRREVLLHSYIDNTNPIVDPEHSSTRAANQVSTNPTGTNVPKNGPWTYPDRNNLAVALIRPDTGEVVAISFHRSNLFNTTNPTVGTRLAPPPDTGVPGVGVAGGVAQNTDWTNAAGRYKILRPRPFDHVYNDGSGNRTDFPYPSQNPDGTWTGDVQNWRWTDGQQRNDSIWMDFNAPVFTYKGRKVKALVAPLIVPLDGAINLAVAGNMKSNGFTLPPDNQAAHGSNQGWGVWEQNPKYVLQAGSATAPDQEFRKIRQSTYKHDYNATPVTQTGAPSPRGVVPTAPNPPRAWFHKERTSASAMPPSTDFPILPPGYSRINFDGGGGNQRLSLPTGTQSDPTYPAGYDDGYNVEGATTKDETANHPSLFNPYQWTDSTSPAKLFPFKDLGLVRARYSDKAGTYRATTQYPMFGLDGTGHSFEGTTPGAPANEFRQLVTTISNALRRSGVPAAYPTTYAANQYTVTTPGSAPTAAVQQYTTALSSPAAGLAPVNLNRKLLDYRIDVTRPMNDPANLPELQNLMVTPPAKSRFQLAWEDRQALANDIFIRLVLATGAKITSYNASTGQLTLPVVPTAADADYDALRYLAQLAANIVDYIDNDDISTPFVWNPDTALPAGTFDPGNFGAEIGHRVVFGTEKPRLVLNEVYAEVANHPMDTVMNVNNDFQVRYWVELLNPGNPLSSTTSFLANGNAQLFYDAGGMLGSTVNISPFKIEVYPGPMPTAVINALGESINVTGDPTAAAMPAPVPRINATFSIPDFARQSVSPVGANGSGVNQNEGFAVVGPDLAMEMSTINYKPNQDPGMGTAVIPLTGMFYEATRSDEAGINGMGGVIQNQSNSVVLLRRLACPYLEPSTTNPYITVDVFVGPQTTPTGATASDYPGIRVRDAIRVATDSTAQRSPMGGASCERAQPFFGNSELSAASTTTDPTATMPMVRRHTLTSGGAAMLPVVGIHNSVHTAQPVPPTTVFGLSSPLPFEWLTHLDRKLINQAELFHVSASPPHELTRRFATHVAMPTAPNPPWTAHQHMAPWFDQGTRLYRALESLSVKPWMYGVPVGGREPGKVNINMIWDKRVLQALLDAQTPTAGAQTGLTPDDVTAIWSSLFVWDGSSTTSVVRSRGVTASATATSGIDPAATYQVNPTLDEDNTATNPDRPFKGLGMPVFTAGGFLASKTGREDTLLRTGFDPDDTMSPTNPDPLLRRTQPAGTQYHPYERYEPLRKLLNNVSTTSDTYLVLFTIGYFEVRDDTADANGVRRTILGKEMYRDTPGDMRAQYSAVVDRSQLAVTNTNALNTAAPNTPDQAQAVFFTELAEPVSIPANPNMTMSSTADVTVQFIATGGVTNTELSVDYEGKTYKVMPSAAITDASSQVSSAFLGTGPDALSASVTATMASPPALSFDPTTGIASVTMTVTIPANSPARIVPSGTAVGPALSGNPGPRTDFDAFTTAGKRKYGKVVPYVNRMVP